MKYYADKRMSNDFQKYRIGQNVNLLRREGNKMSSRYEVVRQRETSVMLRSNNGHIIYRNVSHISYFRTFERNTHCDNRQHIVRVRPHRLRKMPDKFNDFVV
jgi:hypothetical protein